MSASKSFLDLFSDPSPFLRAKFLFDSDEKPTQVSVTHRLGSAAKSKSLSVLKRIRCDELKEFCKFYAKHDGLEFCRTHNARYGDERPLLQFVPASQFESYTHRYEGSGDRAWIMDLNKSITIYRGANAWIAFAEVDSGLKCLTTFLDGDNSGSIFIATPQPWFNILRPIAKDFEALLDRIARDPAAFFRFVRATVTLRGPDGFNYGLKPVEYLRDKRSSDAKLA